MELVNEGLLSTGPTGYSLVSIRFSNEGGKSSSKLSKSNGGKGVQAFCTMSVLKYILTLEGFTNLRFF